MLATLGPLPPPPGRDDQWGFELKWDGIRAVTYISAGSLRLLSRTDKDMTSRYPELAGLASAVDGPLILDGEIVALNDRGIPSFTTLQQRMQIAHPPPELRAAVPVTYLVFDVLHHGGQPQLDRPYVERRQLLESLDLNGPTWRTPPAWFGGGGDVLRASQDQGLEGVVAKRLASTYQPGARNRDWIKAKNIRIQEVVIGGWSPGQGRREGLIGSLLLGIPDPGRTAELDYGGGLRYIGNVGTGFTHQLLTDLARRLTPLAQPASPFTAGNPVPREQARFAHWVQPVIVGEVAYSEFTPDGILRHPAWRGYRPDKQPADVRQE